MSSETAAPGGRLGGGGGAPTSAAGSGALEFAALVETGTLCSVLASTVGAAGKVRSGPELVRSLAWPLKEGSEATRRVGLKTGLSTFARASVILGRGGGGGGGTQFA